MEKVIIIIFLISTGYLFSQPVAFGGHDSLLFDGAGDMYSQPTGKKDCKWKVKHVWGIVTGTKDTTIKLYYECGMYKKEGVGQYFTQVRKPLKDGDELYDHDTLKMEGENFIQIEREVFYGGRSLGPFILTVKSNNFILPGCKCQVTPYGTISDKFLNFVVGDKYFFNHYNFKCPIESQHSIHINMGTKYSLEITEAGELIKVYEGSVEIQPKSFMISANMEMAKLTQDYQNGKITMEEYSKKALELAPKIKDEAVNVSRKIIVEAGSQITVSDSMVSEITPVSPDEEKWWEKQE